MSDNIESQVKEIIAAQLSVDPEKVTSDAKFIEDLGADSLDVVEMLMTIEEEYDVVVPDDVVTTFVTVGDVARYVESNQ